MKTLPLLTFTLLSIMSLRPPSAKADSIGLTNGEKLTGRIRGMERDTIVLETTPVRGYPPVNQRIGKAAIARLEFAPDPERDRLAGSGGPAQLSAIKNAWLELSPFLGVPNSPAARLGLRYARLLMEAEGTEFKDEALGIFSTISKQASEATERAAAGQGRLRTLILLGRSSEALEEAASLLKEEAEPALCAEAHLIVAGGHAKKLRTHLEDNPRWNEDERAGAERDRLRNLALDSCLLAGLGSESPPELAVRGLLGALQIHELCGDQSRALEVARDIAAIYPAHPGAQIAREFLTRATAISSGTSSSTPQTNPTPSNPSTDFQKRDSANTP